MPTVYYPYEDAKSVSLGSLQNGIFTKSGAIKVEAENTAKRFCLQYGLNYQEFWGMVQKNYNFYWKSYTENNPDATKAEILKHQQDAFVTSTRNRISASLSADYISQLNSAWVWLPSSSDNPRDRHEMRYGNVYSELNPPPTLPGEEPNCECGIGREI